MQSNYHQAVAAKAARRRAAKAAHTAALNAAKAQFNLSTMAAQHALAEWKAARLAQLEAEYDQAMRQHAPLQVAAYEQAVAAADANYAAELADADAEYEEARAAEASSKMAAKLAAGDAAIEKKAREEGWVREQRGWLEEHLWPWVTSGRLPLDEYMKRWNFAADDRANPPEPPHLAHAPTQTVVT